MALPASDAFTGTNGTDLPVYSASWTAGTGAIEIQSNAAETDAGGGSEPNAFWNADTFANDQYAQTVQVNAAATGGQIGPTVRKHLTAATRTYYGYAQSSTAREWSKYVAGTWTGLGGASVSATAVNGDVLRIEAEGTTIRVLLNGSSDTAIGSPVTDSAIASGAAGLNGWDSGAASVRAESWTAGNLGAVAFLAQKNRPIGQAVHRSNSW